MSDRGALTATTVAVLCAVIAVGAAFLTVVATQDGVPTPTALVKLADTDAARADTRARPIRTSCSSSRRQHYDGVYYYAIARDPLLLGDAHTKIDQAAYRYGHPMHGWLARVVSLGNDALDPRRAAAALARRHRRSRRGRRAGCRCTFGRTPWGGLLIAASPGLLYAASVSTTECVGRRADRADAARLAARTHRARRRAARRAVPDQGAVRHRAARARGLGVRDARRRAARGPTDLRDAASPRSLAGPAALALWYLYVHAQLDAWPSTYEDGNLGAPFVGWIETFRRAHATSPAAASPSRRSARPRRRCSSRSPSSSSPPRVKALRLRTPLDADRARHGRDHRVHGLAHAAVSARAGAQPRDRAAARARRAARRSVRARRSDAGRDRASSGVRRPTAPSVAGRPTCAEPSAAA